uniref:Uncharacterized protein n=1 Tax=Steinernema glaseri TaxID=37863 RepID=A0A1I8AGW7_9BILA
MRHARKDCLRFKRFVVPWPPPCAEVGRPALWTGNLLSRFPPDFADAAPAVTHASAILVFRAAPGALGSATAASTSSAPSDSGGPACSCCIFGESLHTKFCSQRIERIHKGTYLI